MIKVWTQGSADDAKYFALLFPYVTDPAIHTALGAAITTLKGDTWILDFDKDNELRGFANSRLNKSGTTCHIRFVYAIDDKNATLLRLVKAAIADAVEDECTLIYTNDRQSSELWPQVDFTMLKADRRGEFRRWELKIAQE